MNQMQATGSEDTVEEVVEEEAVIKDAVGEADASTSHQTHHPPKTSKDKLTILERY